MARDISELGADVYDDTPKPQHKISPKKRNYIIGCSIAAVLLAGAVVGTVILCNTALTDYSNVRNVTYYYTPKSLLEPGEEPTAVLYKLSEPDYKYASTFRIPSKVNGYKVVGVASGAFAGRKEIKKVIMPNTIQFVGDRAFASCSNLKSFTWSKNLATVGIDAFSNTAFYNNLLQQKDEMYDLPSGLCIYVGEDYFKAGTALVSGELSDSEISHIKTEYGAQEIVKFSDIKIKQLSNGIFMKNDKIVYVDLPEQQEEVLISTFESCTNLKGFDASHSALKVIGEKAFYGCSKLKNIVLNESLSEIGVNAFAGTAITQIPDLSKVQDLGNGVFANCKNIESVDYPLTYVPQETFKGCSKLSQINWADENAVTYLGISAFEGTAFETFTVPMNVYTIYDGLFKNNDKLQKVSLYGNPTCRIIEGSDQRPESEDEEEEEDEGTIDTFIDLNGEEKKGVLIGIKNIMASAFENCTSLTTIDLYGDDGLHWKGEENEFTFPYSLKRTDGSSTSETSKSNKPFSATTLTKLTITPNLTGIGSYAFEKATSLKTVELDSAVASDKYTLKRIQPNAFNGCTSLETVELPDSLTILGASVFKGCVNLKEVKNFANTGVEAIGVTAFQNCSSLTHLDIPETVGSVKRSAFDGTTSLDYVVIPSVVTEIEDGAFVNCRDRSGTFEKMPIYIDLTFAEADKDVYYDYEITDKEIAEGDYSGVCFDDTTQLYYRLGEGEERVEGRHYWDYDANHIPHEI